MMEIAVEIWREMNVPEETIKKMRARNEAAPAMQLDIPQHEVEHTKSVYRSIYKSAAELLEKNPVKFRVLYAELYAASEEKNAQN